MSPECSTLPRICVFTALTGGYERLNEQPTALKSAIPFICLTDDPDLASETWQVRHVTALLPSDPVRSQRALKLRPERQLPDFDISLYIDNSVALTTLPEALLALHDRSSDMTVLRHSFHPTLGVEFDAALAQGLDDPARIEEQRDHYLAECPDLLAAPFFWGGMMIRDHRSPAVQRAGALWFAQVLRYSRRDQLSFPLALRRAGLEPQVLVLDNHLSAYHSWPHHTDRQTGLRIHAAPACPEPTEPAEQAPLPERAPIEPPDEPVRPAARPSPGMLDRLLPGCARRMWWKLTAPLGYAAGLLDRRDAVRSIVPGRNPTLGTKVMVFVHHDGGGRIGPMPRDTMTAFARAGFDVVLASNADVLRPADLSWATDNLALTVLRRNRGYDFSAWKDALRVAGFPRGDLECLVLANDSLYGPLGDLAPLLSGIDFDKADIWGATDSWQHLWHLQSYFLALGPRAMAHPDFQDFWQRVVPVRSKAAVVVRYEIGFTRAMLAAGLRCAAVWPYQELMTNLLREEVPGLAQGTTFAPEYRALLTDGRRRALSLMLAQRPMNPTAELWLPLIERGFPFIKRELLCLNPAGVPDIAAWRPVLEAVAPERVAAIDHELKLRMRGRSP